MRFGREKRPGRENLHARRDHRRSVRAAAALRSLAPLGLWLALTGITHAAERAAERGENRARIEPRGFIYGGALGVRREIYTDYDRRVIPLPVIGYRGEKLQVFGPFVSYALFDAGAVSVDVRLSPRFAGFDESDSDVFRGMEAREFSMDFGFGLTSERNDWKFELAGLRDMLDRSNGQEWSASLGRAYRAGPVFIEPSVGLSYLDSAHVNYYYGVSDAEAASFRPAYSGDSAVNTEIGVTLATPAFFGGLTRIGIEYTRFDSSISDSPLTDADSSTSVFFAFSKFFGR